MKKINSWLELVEKEMEFESSSDEWVFRGQPSPNWRIMNTLERACKDFNVKKEDIYTIENALLMEFKRSCHLYSPSVMPEENDNISWIALMRHYGAPSRFVDFSFSFFIATYFAVETENSQPVIWAVNKTWLGKHMQRSLNELSNGKEYLDSWGNRESWAFDNLFMTSTPSFNFVTPVNPLKMNDRLAVQQGLFLCATNVSVPFHDSLESIPNHKDNIREIIIDQRIRNELLVRLHRTGINRTMLFPGLQGYAESLRPKIAQLAKMNNLLKRGGRIGPNITGV